MVAETNNDTLVLDVRVSPRASRSEIVGTVNGVLKVRIASPPVDGAANAALIKLLSKSYGVPKRNVEIISGQSSKTKRVRITLKD
jgi:hypothetical protein